MKFKPSRNRKKKKSVIRQKTSKPKTASKFPGRIRLFMEVLFQLTACLAGGRNVSLWRAETETDFKKKDIWKKYLGAMGILQTVLISKFFHLKCKERLFYTAKLCCNFLYQRCCLNHVSNLEPELTDEKVNN